MHRDNDPEKYADTLKTILEIMAESDDLRLRGFLSKLWYNARENGKTSVADDRFLQCTFAAAGHKFQPGGYRVVHSVLNKDCRCQSCFMYVTAGSLIFSVNGLGLPGAAAVILCGKCGQKSVGLDRAIRHRERKDPRCFIE